MSVQVHLERFEGPLSLLLYLIRREEIDIYNIPIHEITTEYMKELEVMSQCDLEAAGDFVAMAATLLHIKSKMLLPIEDDDEQEAPEDPRKGLVEKLLVYQSYKDISQTLYRRPLLGRDLWTRGVRPPLPQEEGEILVDENALFALMAGYKKASYLYENRSHQVKKEEMSLTSCLLDLKNQLQVNMQSKFKHLIGKPANARSQIVVTLLALLELSRIGVLSLFQSDVDSDIYIELKEDIKPDVISKIQADQYNSL